MSRNSDRRKIKDVQNITGQHALKKIAALQPVEYRHIDEDPALPITVGFIAQDFAVEFPDLIRKRKNDDGIKPIKRPKPPRPVPENPIPPVSETPQPEVPAPAPSPGTGGTNTTPPNPGPRTLAALLTDEPIPGPGEKESALAAAEPDDDEVSPTEPEGFSILSYDELIPMLVGAVKELLTQLQTAREQISDLEKKVKKLQPTI
jgi:hypothetical protein